MTTNTDLLIFDPNLVIQLLHININFQFADMHFQQIQGTAIGAAFSPTIANIFMSVILRRFLSSQKYHPILIRRYIHDIFLIWPNQHNLITFLTNLNSFHPNLQFIHNKSETSVDFLDITIYKGTQFNRTKCLDIKTFQKSQNLYQYLHFTSHHPKSVYKGLIIGECKRYIRTNSREEQYQSQLLLFKYRLQK